MANKTGHHFYSNRSRVVLVYNAKGGVGKSSTTFNLAAAFARLGFHVTCLDMDSQQNLTLAFAQGLQKADSFTGTIKDYIDSNGSVSAKNILRTFTFCRTPGGKTGMKDFFYVTEESRYETIPAPENAGNVTRSCTMSLIPGDSEIGSCNLENLGIVRNLVAEISKDQPDDSIILIDCPPQLMPVMSPALFAGDYVLIPVTPTSDAIAGLPTVFKIINEVRSIGFDIKPLGFFINNLDAREITLKESAAGLREIFQNDNSGLYMFKTVVRHASSVERGRSIGQPVVVQEFMTNYYADITNLAFEVIDRINEIENGE